MKSNFYAVLMGFNNYADNSLNTLKYAEKDAQELYDALISPSIGNYPKENIKLITGADILTQDIEKELYTTVVKDRTENDTVLVYYSGHGFIAGEHAGAFLGTPDVTINDILDNPKAGLQMEYLHDKIFRESKARYVIFILDSCHSGAFCPTMSGNFEKGNSKNYKELVNDNYFLGEGRVAFASSLANSKSRESDAFEHGIFTHNILQGLEKATDTNGDVTMSGLVAYVESNQVYDQMPIFYGKMTKIVITTPKSAQSTATGKRYTHSILENNLDHDNYKETLPLSNPIEKKIEYIQILNQHLQTIKSKGNPNIAEAILDAICKSVDAEYATIQRLSEDKKLFHKVNSKAPHDLYTSFNRKILPEVYSFLDVDKKDLRPIKYGVYKPVEGVKSIGQNTVVIPLRLEFPRDFLILTGVPQKALEYGEILGHALISLYQATKELTLLNTEQLVATLVDHIKRDFGHVPYKIYQERFNLFRNELHKVYFGFEPIVQLGRREIIIDSWEALARSEMSDSKAPSELFDAAELWGMEFTTELDLYCLEHAISMYNDHWKTDRPGQKVDPLSVNVYPETLFRDAYIDLLKKIIKQEDLIKGDKLILEISEKRPVPTKTIHSKGDIDKFVNIIKEYAKSLHVRFAIDDFGVEHSSISRLAKLELDYVKIDREILHHPHPKNTLRYVKEILDESHNHPVKIVVEGFDGDSNISLADIFDLGIEYIQGYMIRQANRTVIDLDEKSKKRIIKYMEIL